MKPILTIIFLIAGLTACTSPVHNDPRPGNAPNDLCSETMYKDIETAIRTGDNDGHGPDIGSTEWMSVVERRLGIEGNASVPEKGTRLWCIYVRERI